MKEDLLFVLGLMLACGGLWMAWPPLALVAAGGLIMLAALHLSRARGDGPVSPPPEDDA